MQLTSSTAKTEAKGKGPLSICNWEASLSHSTVFPVCPPVSSCTPAKPVSMGLGSLQPGTKESSTHLWI